MRVHPISEIFPLMSQTEFEKLVEDIREHGQQQPIFTYHGQIIDGRNRYHACQVLKREPVIMEWNGTGSVLSFVVSLNLHRRHLDEAQRGMAAARITKMRESYNAEETVFSSENSSEASPADDQKDSSQICENVSQSDAAKMLNVSPRSVWTANQILEKSEPEIILAVDQGELSLAAASKIAELPRAQQKKAIKKGITRIKELARQITKKQVKSAQTNASGIAGIISDTQTPLTEDQFKLLCVHLINRVPANCARYLENMLEEMEELEMVEPINDAYDKILHAISLGRNTDSEILAYTKLDKELFDGAKAYLLEHNTIYAIKQGGKHDRASGGRKILYFRTDKNYVGVSERAGEST